MKADLRTQIRDLATAYEESLPAIDVVAVVEARRVSVEDAAQEKTVRMDVSGGGDRTVVRPSTGWRGPLVAAGTAVAVLLIVGVAVLALRGSSAGVVDEPVATTTTAVTTTLAETSFEPRTVFSWGDDLSEWVTEEEMTAALRDVVSRYAGADLNGEALFDDEGADLVGYDGQWELGGWTVQFRNFDRDGGYDGSPPETDPRLPRGVTFKRGWGEYIFLGPNSDEMIAIRLRPPGTPSRYPAGSEIEAHEAVLFPLVSWMLKEMGWVDAPEAEVAPAVPTTEPRVPIMGTEQILYATDDLACPGHQSPDLSLPVGTVEFVAGEGMFTVVVELAGAAPNSEYGVEVWEPETCWYGGNLLFEAPTPRVLSTDENGAGRLEFTVDDVEPRTYRLNVGLGHENFTGHEPDADDIRAGYTPLWTIGGAGFSLVEIP